MDSEMRAVSQLAANHVQQGSQLAGRGALYSARNEMLQALRLVAQALDLQQGTSRHSDALVAGLQALVESDDFIPASSQLESNLDVSKFASTHHTPLLNSESPGSSITPLFALQQYYTYAQEQLSIAAAGMPVASRALYGLGRLQVAMSQQNGATPRAGEPKAMVMYQAALSTDPRNHLAANELAVLLAHYGRYEQAQQLLAQCVQINPTGETWHNLAVVYEHLGQRELAVDAQSRSRAAVERSRQYHDVASAPPVSAGLVRWVGPVEFIARTEPGQSAAQFTQVQTVERTQPVAEAQHVPRRGIFSLK